MATKKSMENPESCTKAQYLELVCHDHQHNPVFIKDENFEASLVAYKRLSELIKKMDRENLLTEEEKNILINALEKVYEDRKNQSYLSVRLSSIAQSISKLIEFTISKRKNTDLYYYNSIRHAIKNEW